MRERTIETTSDGRLFIRTADGNVARTTSGEAFYTQTVEKAREALAYLGLDYAARKRAPHWLKSTFGVEGCP